MHRPWPKSTASWHRSSKRWRAPARASTPRAPFMHWALLSLTSAFFLGIYDICQKHALRQNPVVPVLCLSTATCASIWTALLLLQRAAPGLLPASLVVPSLGWLAHVELLFKSAIVAASWLCTY